jgi:hypothetical protein
MQIKDDLGHWESDGTILKDNIQKSLSTIGAEWQQNGSDYRQEDISRSCHSHEKC